MRASLFAAVLCAPPATARLSANPLGTPQELRDTTDLCVGRTERKQKCSVLLDVPADCAGESTKCPIAFFLHGGGGHGSSFVHNGGAAVHAASFIGVYPTGDEGWNTDGDKPGDECAYDEYACTKDNNEPAFIAAIIETLTQMGAQGGVYAYGISNGADLAQKLASNAGAVIPIKGIWASSTQLLQTPLRSGPGSLNFNQPNSTTPKVAQVASHGTEDTIIPYTGGTSTVHHDLPFVLMSEPASDQVWADHNGCSGPPVITNVSATTREGAVTAVHHVWGGCPRSAPVELYQVVGAGHGDAATIGGVDKLALALVFFRNVDGTPAPPTPNTPAPVPTPPAPRTPAPSPDVPPTACTTCIKAACPSGQSPSECKTCLKAHQASCASSCKPYPFAKALQWFCSSA